MIGDPRPRRPSSVRWLAIGLGCLGVTATGGSLGLYFAGEPPYDWLEKTPFDTPLGPALILGIGFGLGSLVVLYGLLRRPQWPWLGWLERLTGHHWAWAGTIAIGLGQMAWIVTELFLLPEISWLQAVYGPLGLALAVGPLTTSARSSLATSAAR
jgi:hypothetical protein